MATLKELMTKPTPKGRERIAEKVETLRQTIALKMLREELNISQTALAMGVKRPTVTTWSRQITIPACRF